MPDDPSRPVKMMLPNDIAIALDDLATKKKRETGNWKIGAGTIAAEIINRIFKDHPELLKEFFTDETSTAPVILAKREAEYEFHPKARSPRQARK